MPLNKIDHKKTIIYKIQHNEKPELVYVGRTTNFASRKSQHKSSCVYGELLIDRCIRENGGWKCFTMSPIKQIECNSMIDAFIEEQKMMDELKVSMNTNKASNLSIGQSKEQIEKKYEIKYNEKMKKLEREQEEFIKKRQSKSNN